MSRMRQVIERYGPRTPLVVLAILAQRLRRSVAPLRRLWLEGTTLGHKGKDIAFGRGLTITPGAHVDIGDKVHLGDRSQLEIGIEPRAHLSIGDFTWISHDCHILCRKSVS